jgi:ATP-dependent protease ClpP protease subunit
MTEHKKIDERIELVHDHWIDPDSRELWIHGAETSAMDDAEPGVEYNMAVRVIKNLHYLRKQSSRASVTIHLHTGGGILEEGLAIYDTIRLMPYPVTIITYTQASSISSVILQAAAGVSDTRLMMPNSHFMFHDGSMGVEGNMKTVFSQVDFAKIQIKILMDVYVKSVKGSKRFRGKRDAQIRKELKYHMDKKDEVYLTAEAAVEWGFADGILETWPSHCRWPTRKKTTT